MFKDDGNLSPDLEWMLQSEQITVDSLIETLVTSYYQHLYLLALSRLSYPEEAHRATQETLIEAILKKKFFRGETSVSEWLETIASGILVVRKLKQGKLQFLNPKLINSIGTGQVGTTLSDRKLKSAVQEIKFRLQGQKYARLKSACLQLFGISSVGMLIVFFVFTLSSALLARMPADNTLSSQQNPMIEASETISSIPAREYPLPTKGAVIRPANAAPVLRLTKNSSNEQIKDRINLSNQLWNTMWADVVVKFYGPSAYVGPPYIARHQLWIDQVEGHSQIIGPPQGITDSLEKILIANGTSLTGLGFPGTADYANIGSQFPWFSIKPETIFRFPFAINYLIRTINQDIFSKSHLSVVGEEIIADREAVIIELTSSEDDILARLWLDTQIGIILKEQYFQMSDNGKAIIESSLREIQFDDSTPLRSKEPENRTLASSEFYPGIAGTYNKSSSDAPDYPMMGFPFRPPPSDYDLSGGKISFAKTDRQDLDITKTGNFHVFADNFFLGNIEMLDPLKMICDRSPDGTKIVMSNLGFFPTEVNDTIYLLDLHNLDNYQIQVPDTIFLWTKISPDNQKIGVIGYDEQNGNGRFYLVDTQTGEFELLPIQVGFSSVAWSPDSKEFVILDFHNFQSEIKSSFRIRIFYVQSGAEKRRFIPKEIAHGATEIEIEFDGWTAEFHPPLQDISHCTSPP